MENILKYKGYTAKVEFSAEEGLLTGTVLGISDLIIFQSESAKDIEKSFHDSLDDYLAFCKEVGKKPEKTFSGTFNIRINPDTHKKAYLKAEEMGISLNKFTETAIEKLLDNSENEKVIVTLPINCAEKYNINTHNFKTVDRNNQYKVVQ